MTMVACARLVIGKVIPRWRHSFDPCSHAATPQRRPTEGKCGVENCEMSQCLREIPGKMTPRHVVLLGEQPEVASDRKHALKLLSSLLVASLQFHASAIQHEHARNTLSFGPSARGNLRRISPPSESSRSIVAIVEAMRGSSTGTNPASGRSKRLASRLPQASHALRVRFVGQDSNRSQLTIARYETPYESRATSRAIGSLDGPAH